MERIKSLLESYYGVGGQGGETASTADVDSAQLDVAAFTGKALRGTGFADLLRDDDRLVQEVRTLDADMQLLVYDNYSKFVSATDTIRSMKHNVDRINSEIDALVGRVGRIESVASEVNARMAPKRERIDKLVGLQKLIRKLNFLFELPLRLRQCVELGAPAQAVLYYSRAVPILQKHSEVASFAAIEKESHAIMRELATSLEAQLRSSSGETAMTVDKLGEAVQLLLQLRAAGCADGVLSPDRAPLARRFLAALESLMQDRLAALVAEQSSLSLIAFIERGCAQLLAPLCRSCATFDEAFLRAPEQGERPPSEEETAALRAELVDTSKPLLVDVLNAMRLRLVADDAAPLSLAAEEPHDADDANQNPSVKSKRHTSSSSSSSSSNSSSDGGGSGGRASNNGSVLAGAPARYKPLLSALDALVSRVRASDELERLGIVRGGFLRDRTTEVAEHVMRKHVVQAFEALRIVVAQRLVVLFDLYAAAASQQQSQSHQSEQEEDEEDKSAPSKRAASVCADIEAAVHAAMGGLSRLLDQCASLGLGDVASIFDNLVRFQMRFWLLWLANALECACEPYHAFRKDGVAVALPLPGGGAAKDGGSAAKERAKIKVAELPVRFHAPKALVLCLAGVADQLRPFCLRGRDGGPYGGAHSQQHAHQRGQLLIAGAPELAAELAWTRDRLLAHFVELAAREACVPMRAALDDERALWQAEAPSVVRPFALHLVRAAASAARMAQPCLGSSGPATGTGTGSAVGAAASAGTAGAGGSPGKLDRKRTASSGIGVGVHQDIERLFTQRVSVVDASFASSSAVAAGVLKTCFKTLLECVRQSTLPLRAFQQLDADLFFLKTVLSVQLDEPGPCTLFLSQVHKCARARALETTPLPQEQLERMTRVAREDMQQQQQQQNKNRR